MECWMLGCGMLYVKCENVGMWNVGMRHGNISPTVRRFSQKPCGLLLSKNTRLGEAPPTEGEVIAPMRTDGSFHGFFTLAPLPTAWVSMRRRRNGLPRIFRMRRTFL